MYTQHNFEEKPMKGNKEERKHELKKQQLLEQMKQHGVQFHSVVRQDRVRLAKKRGH